MCHVASVLRDLRTHKMWRNTELNYLFPIYSQDTFSYVIAKGVAWTAGDVVDQYILQWGSEQNTFISYSLLSKRICRWLALASIFSNLFFYLIQEMNELSFCLTFAYLLNILSYFPVFSMIIHWQLRMYLSHSNLNWQSCTVADFKGSDNSYPL